MRFEVYSSGSHGNAYTLDDGFTRILLECGLSAKRLRELVGKLTDFNACLISHEHKDHSMCCKELMRKGVPCYMSRGTAEALGVEDGAEIVEDREQLRIGTMDIVPFATYHDAEEPLGFLIQGGDGDILAFATDTVSLGYRFPGLNTLAIEANYDNEILESHDRVPDVVKHRIRNTHMEIGKLMSYLETLDLSQCREIWLLHLSDGHSRERDFCRKVQRVVGPGITVRTAPREREAKWHNQG